MSENLTLNGVSLASMAYMLGDISSIMSAAPRRGGNLRIAGRNGELLVPRKKYDPAEFVMPLAIAGALPSGGVPPGSTAVNELFLRRDELLRILADDTVVLEYTRSDGTVRRAVCEVQEVMDFSRVGIQADFRVSIAMRVIGAFWTDIADVAQTITGLTGVTGSLATFSAATAPMDELVVEFLESSNPKIQQGSVSLQYDGIIGAGQSVIVNCADWSISGTGGLTPSRTAVRHFGEQRFFVLAPGNPPEIVFTHTDGASRSVTLSGRRKYLVP